VVASEKEYKPAVISYWVAAIDLVVVCMAVEEHILVVDMEYMVAVHNLLVSVRIHFVAAFVVASLGLVAAAFISPSITAL